jgi:hypothetical protein
MSEEILINITPMESRVAVVENGVLQEVHVERTQRRGIVGNIYKGKVVRVAGHAGGLRRHRPGARGVHPCLGNFPARRLGGREHHRTGA